MVKFAHIVVITPGRCGLYETTRELVAALQGDGIDARMCDPTKDKNQYYPDGDEDRGAPIADIEWAKSADVLINHSGLGRELEETRLPVVLVSHGRPRSSFLSEVGGGTPIYSYHYHKNLDARLRAVVTFWPEHKPYLEVMFSRKPVCVVPPPVDLQAWAPEGPRGYRFHGHLGRYNVVCTDAWRDDIDPFVAVNGFAVYARTVPGMKLHIYGRSGNLRGWAPLLKSIQDDGNLGEVRRWVSRGLDNVYRAATCLVTPHTIHVRSIREAMACGCPVVNGPQVDWIINGLDALIGKKTEFERELDRQRTREQAVEQFAPDRTADRFASVITQTALAEVA